MFQQRQLNEIYSFMEVSQTPAQTPGAITNGSLVSTAVACTIQGTTNPATFTLGDVLDVLAPASAALNGVAVSAQPTGTPGTCQLIFLNNTGGSVTPVAGSVYKIVARRVAPTVI
jgi:hypothetical protein